MAQQKITKWESYDDVMKRLAKEKKEKGTKKKEKQKKENK